MRVNTTEGKCVTLQEFKTKEDYYRLRALKQTAPDTMVHVRGAGKFYYIPVSLICLDYVSIKYLNPEFY